MAEHRVVVVGAGPAGTRAAEVLVRAGLRPTLVDEGQRSGGQIYRRPPPAFRRGPRELYGFESARAVSVHRGFDALLPHIDYRPRTTAWHLYDKELHVGDGQTLAALPFDSLVIASGATDRLLPMPGWTLPGVYSLGGAQVALKAQGCAIGNRVVFMGTGPLLYLAAYQYAKAGAQVAALLDTSPAALRWKALPLMLSKPATLAKGAYYVAALRRMGVRMVGGIEPIAIEGEAGVARVRYRTAAGDAEVVEADAVALGYHLRPETQLADLARCEFDFDALRRQWHPRIDAMGRSTTPGVYLAGDGARVLGADAAEISGRLAAHAVLQDLGRAVPAAELSRLFRMKRKEERFQRGIAIGFPLPVHLMAGIPDATLVCRCEAIAAADLRRTVRELGAPEVNRAKALCRVGMGRCQGRYCGIAAAEIICAETSGAPADVGRLRGQGPVKPLPIRVDAGGVRG